MPDILFCPGGGIGDAVISVPILDFVLEKFSSHAFIDVLIGFPRDIYREIIGNRQKQIRYIFERTLPPTQGKYQGSVEANEICRVMMSNSFASYIQKRDPKLMDILKEGQKRIELLGLNAIEFPHHTNELANLSVSLGLNRRTLPIYTIGLEPRTAPDLFQLVMNIPDHLKTLTQTPFLTFNDGWAGDTPHRDHKILEWMARVCNFYVASLALKRFK